MTSGNEDWDYIIVGAGSAGCVLANRLSADPSHRVLLIEAGGADISPYIHVPAAIIRCVGNPTLDWCLLAEPDSSRNGVVDLWPAGKVLGGSSSINGMLFVRGQPADFDAWSRMGNHGWSYEELLPYFRRMETTSFGDPIVRGRAGPMHVSRLRTRHPLGEVFAAALQDLGLPHNMDYNGRDNEGVAEPQVTQKRGARFSASRAFLWPVRSRSNLRIEKRTRCLRLTFADGRCTGAEIQCGNDVRKVRARREVILSAGTLATPKILMLSGIGPGAQLQEHGIGVRVDSPAVGENLLEHPNALVSADVNVPTYNVAINSASIARHMANWLLFRRGPATSPYPHAVAFFRSHPDKPHPNLQALFGPYAFAQTEHGIVPYLKPAVTAVVNTTHPRNPGRIRLRSADPESAPIIEHRLLESAEDIAELTAGCRLMRLVFQSSNFKPYIVGERMPGPGVQSDDEWAEYLRRTTTLGYHPVGTCRMGADAHSVVTPSLAVRGVEGLRVADASIMPTLISANTHAATMMIGERAADLALGIAR